MKLVFNLNGERQEIGVLNGSFAGFNDPDMVATDIHIEDEPYSSELFSNYVEEEFDGNREMIEELSYVFKEIQGWYKTMIDNDLSDWDILGISEFLEVSIREVFEYKYYDKYEEVSEDDWDLLHFLVDNYDKNLERIIEDGDIYAYFDVDKYITDLMLDGAVERNNYLYYFNKEDKDYGSKLGDGELFYFNGRDGSRTYYMNETPIENEEVRTEMMVLLEEESFDPELTDENIIVTNYWSGSIDVYPNIQSPEDYAKTWISDEEYPTYLTDYIDFENLGKKITQPHWFTSVGAMIISYLGRI